MKTNQVISMVCAALLGVSNAALVDGFNAGTLYVDQGNPQAGDGSSSNPFRTVRSAVEAATDGCRIVLKAGTYCDEKVSVELDGVDSLSRIVLNKKVYLLGAGRDRTFILGSRATTAPDEDGLGEGAVRGILVTDAAKGSIIEGLTIKNGYTVSCDVSRTINDETKPNIRERKTADTNQLEYAGANYAACGGGVYFTGTSRDGNDLVTMVDCSIEDCRSGYSGGAVYGNIRMVRCYVARSYAATFQGGTIARVPVAFSSIFAGNGKVFRDCGDTLHAAPECYDSNYVEGTFVNCTFNANLGGGVPVVQKDKDIKYFDGVKWRSHSDELSVKRYRFYNSIFWVHGDGPRHVTTSVECRNCCQNKFGSLYNHQVNVLDKAGNPIPKDESTFWQTNDVGNVGSDYYPRLNEDVEGTTVASSPCKADSAAKDYCPAVQLGLNQFVCGYGRDVRLREGSILIDYGSTRWYLEDNKIPLMPVEYLEKDFYGQPRVQGGQVDQGAAEGGFTKGTDYALSVTGSYPILVNGCRYNRSYFEGLSMSGVPGAELELGVDVGADKEIFAFVPSTLKVHDKNSYASPRYAFPSFREKSVRIRVEDADRIANETYTVTLASKVKWADSENGNDSAEGTEAAPFKTLQKAVDEAGDKGMVIAKPGVYKEGGSSNSSGITDADWSYSTGCRVRIAVNLRIVGIEGAEKTVIMGQATTATSEQIETGEEFVNGGCGTGARRCIGIEKGKFVQVQGFTLTGGHTDSDPVGKAYAYQVAKGKAIKSGDDFGVYNWGGGAVVGGSSPYHNGYDYAYVEDCIVSNNVAYHAAALLSCFARRCVITGNRNIDPTKETNKVEKVGFACNYTTLSRCNVFSNDVAGVVAGGNDFNSFYNNIFFEPNNKPLRDGSSYNNIFYNCKQVCNHTGLGNVLWPDNASWSRSGTHIVVDPLVGVDSCGRLRIAKGSPALASGVADTTTDDAFGYVHTGPGLDGFAADFEFTNVYPAGSTFADFAAALIVVGEGENRAIDSEIGMTPSGRFLVPNPWDSPVFEATDPRSLDGFKVNGALIGATGRTFVWRPEFGSNIEVAAVYAEAQDWFANAAAVDDSGDGRTVDTPKKTLNAAFTYARAGDVVHLAEGVYSDNVQVHDRCIVSKAGSKHIIPAVGVIPSGVTLVGDGERDKTRIEGKWGTGVEAFQNMTFGEDAIRCLVAYENTKIKGVTLCNGGALGSKYADGSTSTDEDKQGGAVLGCSSTVYEDCLFSNCVANTQAAFSKGGTAIRCTFFRIGASSSAVCVNGELYNCYVDRCFDAPISLARVVKNCTLGPNNRISFDSNSFCKMPIQMNENGVLENTVVLSKAKDSNPLDNNLRNVKNCLFDISHTNRFGGTTWGEGCAFKSAAELNFSDSGMPLPGSVAIDSGCNDSLEDGKSAGTDLNGDQRISNRTVDIGCYEYDWRPKYKRDLWGDRKGSVSEASSDVWEDENRNVQLVDGAKIVITWPGNGKNYLANFDIEGDGELSVTELGVGKSVFTKSSKDKFYRTNTTVGDVVLEFAYSGTETATLKKFRSPYGLALIVR